MKKHLRIVLIGLATLISLLILGVFIYLQRAEFGADPAVDQLQRSPHFRNGEFHNLIPTPVIAAGQSALSITLSDLMNPVEMLHPADPVPVVKIDLKALDPQQDTVVWLGHASFFVQLAGRRILVDPVFKPHAGPVSFAGRAFDGTNVYTADDMPDIDLILITHDHWDHLDFETVTALETKTKRVLVPLGIGAHFQRWGYGRDKLHEADWYEKLAMGNGLAIHLVPARHYSGRALTRNKTLWTGFVLESDKRRVLLSGDTGYGPHFKEIGKRFGNFDLVALDMGQYDPRWPDIHMNPEEAAQAAEDLNAKALLPAHIGRFSIARHTWDEPFKRISSQSKIKSYRLLTPQIGEAIKLSDEGQQFSPWWVGVR
jgi:L-ascorbate metabolism protein UlaG (beta-lactamase superfamily)